MAVLKLDLLRLARTGTGVLNVDVPADSPLWATSDLDLRAPVRVRLQATPVGQGGYHVVGTLGATVGLQCRRCLDDVVQEVNEPIAMLFQPRDEAGAEAGSAEVYDLEVGQTEFDLAEPVREQLLLVAPTYAVCRTECRGLCPRCGVNLNEETCVCAAPEVDPRWQALRTVKLD